LEGLENKELYSHNDSTLHKLNFGIVFPLWGVAVVIIIVNGSERGLKDYNVPNDDVPACEGLATRGIVKDLYSGLCISKPVCQGNTEICNKLLISKLSKETLSPVLASLGTTGGTERSRENCLVAAYGLYVNKAAYKRLSNGEVQLSS